MARQGTYRSACGCLLHRRTDATGRECWEAEDESGACRDVELAPTARPTLLSDDPDWPSGTRVRADPAREED